MNAIAVMRFLAVLKRQLESFLIFFDRSQEEGKAVPEEAVLNMKANFVLPDIEEPFTEVLYSDLSPQVPALI